MKVSIIIPVYNTEKYITKCLESVCQQSYKNLEILIIDDGSFDNSPAICDEFAKKDSRVHVIHKENGGQSSARNIGIEIATGDYLFFVDSDDFIHPECISRLVNQMTNNNADIVMCQLQEFLDEKKINYKSTKEKISVFSGYEMCNRLVRGLNGPMSDNIICNKLYKKELFTTIKQPEGMVCEDVAITHLLYYSANTFVITDDILYFYRSKREGSTTNSGSKIYRDLTKALKMRLAFFENINEDLLVSFCKYYLINNYARYIQSNVYPDDKANLITEQRQLYQNLNRNLLPFTNNIVIWLAVYARGIFSFLDSIKYFVNTMKTWKMQGIKVILADRRFKKN